MADETMVNNTESQATGAGAEGQNLVQEETKVFTQEQVNEIVSKRLAQVKSKYSEIDVEEYRNLKNLREQVEEEQMMKRQDFESLLKKTKEKADTEVTRLRSELESIKIDGALIAAASRLKSVAPDQTARLLRDSVKLDSTGKVVIMDADGQSIRYNDDAELLTVDQLVEEFLNKNSYFKSSGPAGTGSHGNNKIVDNQKVDLSQLDLTKAKDRDIYREWKRSGKI